MYSITLITKVYGAYRNRLIRSFSEDLALRLSELAVSIHEISSDSRGHIIVKLEGLDAEFAVNVLTLEYKKCYTLNEVQSGDNYRGQLQDVGKIGYGLYVDIGVIHPHHIDVLLPLHHVRSEVKMPKSSIRRISDALVLPEYLPIDVKILQVDKSRQTIEGEIAESTLERIQMWIADDHERLLVFGANRKMIDDALLRSGHSEDIYEVEELGAHEWSLVCKWGTRASGILAAIGPLLRGVPMHLFIPHEIEANRSVKT